MDSFSGCFLGHEQLDSHHSVLFDLADSLRESLKAGAGEAVLADCLERLWAYMVVHFAAEDQLMMEVNYPDAAKHRLEHDSAMARVRQLERTFRSGVRATSEETMRFVESWATAHIPNADRKLAEYLEAKRNEIAVQQPGKTCPESDFTS